MSKGVKIIKLDDRFKEVIAAASGENIMKALKAGGEVVRVHTQLNSLAQKLVDTTNLLGSITVQEGSSTETQGMVEIGTPVEYAAIHEFGGVIVPRVAKSLSWITEEGDRVFAKSVTIPARPYLRPAMDENESDIKDAIGQSLVDQIKGVL